MGKPTQIEVETCSQPSVSAYEWKFNNTDLRPGIEGTDTSIINIPEVRFEDLGEYTCFVSNGIDVKNFSVDLFPQSKYKWCEKV